MNYVTLDDVKAHLRITGTDEDALLTTYANAAEEYVTEVVDVAPWDTIRVLILLLVGDFYENREAQVDKALSANPAVDRLLNSLRFTV